MSVTLKLGNREYEFERNSGAKVAKEIYKNCKNNNQLEDELERRRIEFYITVPTT